MKKFIKQNIYKWHKIIGLITVIPVIFWTLSGLMHPFLAHWFKPAIAHEFILPKPLDKNELKLSIKEVLEKNGIEKFKGIRMVNFDGQNYYQVKSIKDQWLYFNTQSGEELANGDQKYAIWLSRYFLADSISRIKSISLQSEFSQEYKYINRLLPVWKVSFDRADAMDVFVETPFSRLGTFNPTSRKVFLWVFDNFHNWTFLGLITNNTIRIMVMIVLLGIISISAISGIVIYGFMWKKFKKPTPENPKSVLRKYHRQIGISVAFVSLTFAFSGGFHATRKLEPNILPQMVYQPILETKNLSLDFRELALDWERVSNISVIKSYKDIFYQVFYLKTEDGKSPAILYFNVLDGKEWENGNTKYATFLANRFQGICLNPTKYGSACCVGDDEETPSALSETKLLKSEMVYAFEKREYGFAFKRLPVVRLSYDTPEKTNYYIETATSRLAAKIENSDRIEGYSFAIFHKFLFMEWAGKNVRDIAMMVSALGVLVVSLFGLALFLRK